MTTKKPLLSTKTREVFSCFLGKIQGVILKIGLRSGRSAATEPDFCVQQQKNTEIAVVQIEFLCFASNY